MGLAFLKSINKKLFSAMTFLTQKGDFLKKTIICLYSWLVVFGIDFRKTILAVKGLSFYFRDLNTIKKQMKNSSQKFPFGKKHPCLSDKFSDGGTTKGHYFNQDLLVARRIFRNNPVNHFDVGSRIDGFVAHIASFRSITVLDIRPLSSNIPNIKFIQGDLMAPLSDECVACCDSLSCLHALEHFGLGRYADPVNCDGYLLGLSNLLKMLKKNGKFYFSVPIGPQRIEFNAHRIFSVEHLLECFAEKCQIDRFSYVDDSGELHENVTLDTDNIRNNFGCRHGCGIFEMTKII